MHMHNMQQMMKQAEALQKKVMQVQEDLGALEVEGTAGGGLVKVTMSCKRDVKGVKIDKSLLNSDDAEMLEDLIVAAFNNATHNAVAKAEEEMQKLGLPPSLTKMGAL